MNTHKFEAIIRARNWLNQSPLFLDTETTGLGNNDEVVDLALIDSDGVALIDSAIRPTIPISSGAAAIHGITNSRLTELEAPTFVEIFPKLVELTEGRLVLIYNAEFDLRILKQSANAHKIKHSWTGEAGCAMNLYAEYYGDWNEYRGSYTWQSQAKAARQLGLDLPPDLHRAAADAQLCRAIVEAMAATELGVI